MRVCWMKWTSGLTGDGEDDRIKSRVEFAWCKRVSDMSVRLNELIVPVNAKILNCKYPHVWACQKPMDRKLWRSSELNCFLSSDWISIVFKNVLSVLVCLHEF